uniref:J domain-containing protein n=1 Tax=Chrysotila carterae TaxID=13221 RepID=A0A7S4BDF6_CHRCT
MASTAEAASPCSSEAACLYARLNLARTASGEEIRKAYRVLALRLHPDKGGDAEAFKRVSEAYSVLSDVEKKRVYDATGQAELADFDLDDFLNSGMLEEFFTEMMMGSGLAQEMIDEFGGEVDMNDLQASFQSFFKASLGVGGDDVLMPDGTRVPASAVPSLAQLDALEEDDEDLEAMIAMLAGGGMGGIGGLSGLSALGFPSLRGAEADALLASLDASNEAGLMAMLAGLPPSQRGSRGGRRRGRGRVKLAPRRGSKTKKAVQSKGESESESDGDGDGDGDGDDGLGRSRAAQRGGGRAGRGAAAGAAGRIDDNDDDDDDDDDGAKRLMRRQGPGLRSSTTSASSLLSSRLSATDLSSKVQVDTTLPPEQQWMQAAKSGSVVDLKRLHEQTPSLLGAAAKGIGHTALHWSAAAGHLEAIRWLLDAGCEVNVRNAGDSTPLHSAAGSGHAEACSELIARGADVGALDSGDETAAGLAAARGHAAVVALLKAAA